jgi:16S rRNA (guanine966-N2)-methyltransferase
VRVIAGTAGGLRLIAPRGRATRPTADRVREALFAALGDLVVDASVLDLFAGSGALAVEALSRGARTAVLVDRDRRAVEACRQNLTSTGLIERARVQATAAETLVRAGPPPEAPFDLVFLDPPYETRPADLGAVLGPLAQPGWLVPGGRVVVETRVVAPPQDFGPGWVVVWQREYGDTLIRVTTAAA